MANALKNNQPYHMGKDGARYAYPRNCQAFISVLYARIISAIFTAIYER